MIRRPFLLALATLLIATLPVLAQRGGRYGRAGSYPYGNSFYRGGSGFSFGITLGSPVVGPGFTYGPYGGYYGSSHYRPYYGGYGPSYGSFYSPRLVIPQTFIVPPSYGIPQTSYVFPQAVVGPPTVTTPPLAAPPAPAGLAITELKPQGTARAAGLRQGDVILALDGQRVQTYEELRAYLTTSAGKQVRVEFIDGSNQQIDRKTVAVVDSKLGIIVEEVALK